MISSDAALFILIALMLGVPIAQFELQTLARRKGRDTPFNIPISMQLPDFVDGRISRTAERLLGVQLVGLMLCGVAIGVALASQLNDDAKPEWTLLIVPVAYAMVATRSLYIQYHWVYSEIRPSSENGQVTEREI